MIPGMDAAGLEAEYNNRAKVPAHPAIIARWAEDAAAFRATHGHAEPGLAYGPNERQALDLFWPGPKRTAPLALFLHGGYWQGLHRSFFSHYARGLLAHGVAVAVPSYDLCPDVSLDVIVGQVRDCAAFLFRRHARPMLAAGHSAGGHLAAMLMATNWGLRGLPSIISAGLPISGLFDLAPLVPTSINAALRLDTETARQLSPLFMTPPGRPLHAVVGGEEGCEYTRQSRELALAWGGTWEALPGDNHFTVAAGLAEPDSTLVRGALALLAEAGPG